MLEQSRTNKSDAGAKAYGFYLQMNTFDFLFYFELLTRLFRHIYSVNTALQKKTLCFQVAISMISTLKLTLEGYRKESSFDTFWGSVRNRLKNFKFLNPLFLVQKKNSQANKRKTVNSQTHKV